MHFQCHLHFVDIQYCTFSSITLDLIIVCIFPSQWISVSRLCQSILWSHIDGSLETLQLGILWNYVQDFFYYKNYRINESRFWSAVFYISKCLLKKNQERYTTTLLLIFVLIHSVWLALASHPTIRRSCCWCSQYFARIWINCEFDRGFLHERLIEERTWLVPVYHVNLKCCCFPGINSSHVLLLFFCDILACVFFVSFFFSSY